jgi:hypothetical protein
LPHGPLTAVDDRLSISLSLSDLPDLPGAREAASGDDSPLVEQLLSLSELSDLRPPRLLLEDDDPVVIELPGEWQQPSEPLF